MQKAGRQTLPPCLPLPDGIFLSVFWVLAVLSYAVLLGMLLFDQGKVDEALREC